MSNRETLVILLALLIGAALLAGVAHWFVGWWQRRLAHRFRLAEPATTEAIKGNSLRRLVLDWIGNGLRTALWTAFLLFAIRVIPQTQDNFREIKARWQALRDGWDEWFLHSGISLLVTIVVTIFLMRFASALIATIFEVFEYRATIRGETSAHRRSQTLSTIFRGIAQSVVLFIGAMKTLQHLGVDVTPILASAGLVGIAVGFGAQSLIKDLFAGFLILLEDQYNVGDTVKIGETTGTVERMMLRSTQIRALDGALTTIPNGTIATVANFSKDWSRIVLDVEVDYTEDADRALQLMLTTARELRQERPDDFIEDPVPVGLEKLTNASLALRLTAKTRPAKQADLTRELRRRIKLAFDAAGIKAPVREQLILAQSDASASPKPA